MTEALDTALLPLHGRHLIEASAGTGKTFTVANLYLRLLIDSRDHPARSVEEILVVTFTNAATEELRARLRLRIEVALMVLDGENPKSADATLHDVLEPHLDTPDTRLRLEVAYRSMDQAAIFTIHGFCDRMLREQAFESGELFDAELQADDDIISLRAAEAWWREQITPMKRDATESIPGSWRYPAGVLKRLSSVISDPDGQVVPSFTDHEVTKAKSAYEAAWQAFSASWKTGGDAWGEEVLAGVLSKVINKERGKYTQETVETSQQLANALANHDAAPDHMVTSIEILGNSVIGTCTRKSKTSPESPVGERIDDLVRAYNVVSLSSRIALQCSAKEFISTDIKQRKQLARERTFDDLLFQLHKVLYSDSGDRLTEMLRTRFPVALIDEFQDTDRIQYEIFDRLYPVEEESTRALYLVGDPKQSIYRFRGADINIYLRARESARQTHHLDKNWRSSTRLVNALNALYAKSPSTFGAIDIHYQQVIAGGAAEGRALTVDGQEIPPLQFDTITVQQDKLPNNPEVESELARACANRVAWMLGDDHVTLGNAPVQSRDIAVLVANHIQAQLIRQTLAKVGVGSAMQSRENVLNSAEALDILAFIRVLARRGDSTSLSRVLVSPLGGMGASELLALRDDAAAWQQIETSVERCREHCLRAGPLAAVLRFMTLFNSRVNALKSHSATSRGIDRILGNYLHLADVLQTSWQEQPDLAALQQTAQRWRDHNNDQTLQLRLESDEDLVQIVTIHKSKGLQYPVVMLPFASMGRTPKISGDAVPFTEDGYPRVDLGSELQDERRRSAELAESQEALRVLYVALTRAEQSCWIGVSANKKAKDAALWQLLGLPLATSTTDSCQTPVAEALSALEASCKDIAVAEALKTQVEVSNTEITTQKKTARTATRTINASWRVGSYSALARGATHSAEQPDHDAVDAPAPKPETIDYTDPFHFPRGADAGTLVHAVFEHWDFNITDAATLEDYSKQKLREYNVETEWSPALSKLVRTTLDTPLIESGFKLADLHRKDRLDELSFHFAVKSLTADKLLQVLREGGIFTENDGLQFDELKGYMTGFIDLTFRHDGKWYIADYKSNHLGYDPSDYSRESLHTAMQHHRYDLQYLIYAVALQRYLKTRIPGFDAARDFGGVFYLFVRGMPGATESDSPTGVYMAQPAEHVIQALDQLLSGEH